MDGDKTGNKDSILEINLLKTELDFIEKEKAKGIIMRSKVRWIEEGESNSKYFFTIGKIQLFK